MLASRGTKPVSTSLLGLSFSWDSKQLQGHVRSRGPCPVWLSSCSSFAQPFVTSPASSLGEEGLHWRMI